MVLWLPIVPCRYEMISGYEMISEYETVVNGYEMTK